jgi:hypothetical protein
MGLFSRLAQATYLLSQVLASTAPTVSDKPFTFVEDQTEQLRRTLISLVYLADKEAVVRQLEFCPHSTLCFM